MALSLEELTSLEAASDQGKAQKGYKTTVPVFGTTRDDIRRFGMPASPVL